MKKAIAKQANTMILWIKCKLQCGGTGYCGQCVHNELRNKNVNVVEEEDK